MKQRRNIQVGNLLLIFMTSIFCFNVLHDNFHLMEHFPTPPVALQWLLLHSAPEALRYLQVVDPKRGDGCGNAVSAA
ncbi:putative cytoplasmic protein [Salmonella enterica subsp. enterica]|uniref:Putative cytoplasmic protein n=1 Tax=Salmonella enterica I TaxID=59201 RepID=A0A447U070_SALET|nr:putative cytoplasmic protein [Salmonella enterica subsp. enterica]